MATLQPDGQQANNQQLEAILQLDQGKNGAPVHSFNPEDTPQQKAAAAGKNRGQLKSIIGVHDQEPRSGVKELSIDPGNSGVIPTITVENADVVDEKSSEDKSTDAQQAGEVPVDAQIPGALPSAPAPAIPDWYKIGWRAVSGIDEPVATEGEGKHKYILDAFLHEQYYGEWYHSAGVIVTTVIVTHFLSRFNFGLGWILIVLAFASTYYSTTTARFRIRARDDIQRELVKSRLLSEHESADWLNNFLDRFWLIYEPVLAMSITATVDQVLSTNCPTFLDSLRLTHFTLGKKAPQIVRVRTHPQTAEDIVMMDWTFSFIPHDTSDKPGNKNKNPKIILAVRMGKGVASATIPVLVENMSFSGIMRVRMKLMTNFPHIQLVDLSFLEKPVFDYVLKPVGGETFGFDVGNIPGLSSFIREMIHSIMGPMMYDPNVFTLNLEQLLSGEPLDTAIGVLQVFVRGARGIRGSKIGGGTPDPFVSLNLNNRGEVAKTHYKSNTTNPSWHETKFLLVNSLQESLILNVMDYNDHLKNSQLGSVTFDLSKLLEDSSQEGIETPILKEGKEKGVLRFDVNFYPVLKPQVDGSGVVEELPETSVGIVRLTIHQAKGLDGSKVLSGDLSPFVKVNLGSQTIHKTPVRKHTDAPVWESAAEFLCSDKASSVITVKVIDDRDFLKDPVIGYLSIRLEDLLEAKKKAAGRDWWPLSGCKSGKVRMSAEWKPLNMAGSLHGVDSYVPPIGVVRLWLKKAVDVKNVEAGLGGKSDPYVRVQIHNVTVGRTEVVNNNLSPVWDQILYIPVHNLKEVMLLECMDYQHLTKDRLLGYVDLRVADLAAKSDESGFTSLGKIYREDNIKLDKGGFKGQLFYEAEFIPATRIKGMKFDSKPNQVQQAAQSGYDTEGGGTVESDDGESSSDEEAQAVPHGVTIQSPVSPPNSADPTANGTSATSVKSPTRRTHKKSSSTDTTGTVTTPAGSVSQSRSVSVQSNNVEEEGVEMSTEELLQHQSGIVVFNIVSGHLQKKARLEVLLDDAYWPAFSTVRPPSTNAHWDTIGEGFIKELDFGRVWLRLDVADEGDKDDIIAEWRGDAKGFLQQTLGGPATFTLQDVDDEDKSSTVVIECRYMPVPVTLEPRESINNMGLLNVTLMNGVDIMASDRNGKSDPFAVLSLNGRRVYKSQTKKKTLKPVWDENFDVQVPSRVGAEFLVELFDWNQIEQAKSLGVGKIDLVSIEPFEPVERTIPLYSDKHGQQGHVTVRLNFRPEIIVKARKNTSTFSTAGRAMTQIGALPVGAGKGVVHGFTGVFKRDRNKSTTSESEDEAITPTPATAVIMPPLQEKKSDGGLSSRRSIPELAAGQASRPLNGSTLSTSGFTAAAPDDDGDGQQREGILRVTVIDAKDITMTDVKPYVTLRVGDKERKTKHLGKTETPEWGETLEFSAGPAQPTIFAWIYDHKTLGKDKLLGSAQADIWRHLKPGVSSSAEVLLELREGQGLLRLRLDFDATGQALRRRRSSISSINAEARAPVPSPSRFSLSRRSKPVDD
ncbi:tricalbin [Cristinia sonorae]|uniref:Tricalbin n=1 Tax=Cristinia sonorae TaxID=1940300 RepID=A0A8K0UFU0_9AGAR|nr:tricalbin [Cristinia sonorae]